MPDWRAIYFADVFFSLFLVVDPGAKSSKNTGRIFTTFSEIGRAICKGLINFAFIWQSLKGRCHGNQQKSENRRLSRNFFLALPLQNELEYRNGNEQLRSALNVATSCTTLVRLGAVTPKRLLIFVLLWKEWQKWAYPADYLKTRSTDLDQLFSFDGWG